MSKIKPLWEKVLSEEIRYFDYPTEAIELLEDKGMAEEDFEFLYSIETDDIGWLVAHVRLLGCIPEEFPRYTSIVLIKLFRYLDHPSMNVRSASLHAIWQVADKNCKFALREKFQHEKCSSLRKTWEHVLSMFA